MAIKRLKKNDTYLAWGVSNVEESQGPTLGPGKMCFLGQFG
jgi:hypothetical protein